MATREPTTVPDGMTSHEAERYFTAAERCNVLPLWPRHEGDGYDPTDYYRHLCFEQGPFVWRWRDMVPLIDGAVRAITMDATERRLLGLVNPTAPARERSIATPTINATLQVLMPGERAAMHRHSLNALRFVMDGNGATTIVDGKPCAMNEGDVIITPAWTWHEHVHEGSGRMVWFNCLDVGLQLFLGTNEFEPGPARDLPKQLPDSAFAGSGLVPASAFDGKPYSPVFRYGWDDAVQALSLMPCGEDGSRTLRYTNPVTGGPVMALLDCYLVGLGQGLKTRFRRSTSSEVCVVAEGAGVTEVGEETIVWEKNDVFALPHGNWVSHCATSPEAKLFTTSDREILRRLDLLKDEYRDRA